MDRKKNKAFGDTAFGLRKRQGVRDLLLERQENRCAGCDTLIRATRASEKDAAHLDHDHITGQIRGVLCGSCNWAIGHAKDSSAILRRLADYLEKDGNSHDWQ